MRPEDIDLRVAYYPSLISGYKKTLKEILDEHPEIEHGCLIYAWEQGYHCYLPFYDGDSADVSQCLIDEEYSIVGDRESLYKHAEDYRCWDSEDFMLFGNVLYSVKIEADMQRSTNDGYIHDLDNGIELDWFDVIYIYYDPEAGKRFYIHPAKKTEPDWRQMKGAGQ